MTLTVHVDGAAESPTIVLLHAIGTSSQLWLPQVPALATQFRVVRVDLPGHGASPAPTPGAGFAEYSDAVADALTEHGIDEFILAGISFGAMVAVQIAVDHAPRVRGLVLACCGVVTSEPVSRAWRERIAAVESDGMGSQVESSLERWFTPAFAAASPVTLAWVRSMIAGTTPEGFTGAADMIAGLDHSAHLTKLDMPSLVIAGERDQAAPPTAMRAFADTIATARFETIDAAHLANVEAPVAFTERLGAFAREL